MLKRIGILLLVAMLVVSSVGFALGNGKGNGYGKGNGLGSEMAADASKKAEVEDNNMLGNPTFVDAFTLNQPNGIGAVDTEDSWLFYTNSGAMAEMKTNTNGVKVTPTNIVEFPWGIQLIQAPITLEQLGIYKVSITAHADIPRDITVKVGANSTRGWKAYLMEDMSLTADKTTYEFTFSMFDMTDTMARFELFFGQDMAPAWIHHVSLERIGTEEPIVTYEDLMNRKLTEADEDLVEDWNLVWSDEFDDSAINESNWTFEIGNGAEKGIPGWGNAELQYYTDSPENAFIDNGSLVIRALEEEKNFTVDGTEYTTGYTSARMITQDKVYMTYGKIETRVKVPKGQGIWSAFWMLGQDIGTVGWPQCGEIDILEYLGNNVGEVHGTVHGAVTAGPGINGHIDLGTDLSEDYHVYGIEWDEDEIEFYVDDVLYHIVNKDETEFFHGKDEWVFDHDHFLILNLAIGGNWPGSPDATTPPFPHDLLVDYIRVYEDVNPESITGLEIIDPEMESQATYFLFEEAWLAGNLLTEDNGVLTVDVNTVGDIAYSPQVYSEGFNFEQGSSYKVTFTGSALDDKKMNVNVGLGLDHDPWWVPFAPTYTTLLTATDTEHSFEFTMNNTSTLNGKLVFELGNIEGDATLTQVTLRDIVVEKVETSVPELTAWTLWSGEGGVATHQTVDTGFTAEVHAVGNFPWSVQMFQEGHQFVQGKEYLVEFDAASVLPKTINVNVGMPLAYDPWWTGFAQTETYEIGPSMTHYSFTFVMEHDTFDHGKMVFELGNVPGNTSATQITVENISITELN